MPHYLTDADREWLRQRLIERAMTRSGLARLVGVTRQTIYLLISGRLTSTSHWDAIVGVVGGTPPNGHSVIEDPRLAELVQIWPEISDEDRHLLEMTARRLATKRP